MSHRTVRNLLAAVGGFVIGILVASIADQWIVRLPIIITLALLQAHILIALIPNEDQA